MRLSSHKQVASLFRLEEAQKHHNLYLTVYLDNNVVTKAALECFLQSGLLLFYCKKTAPLTPTKTVFTCTLRYWEGQPVLHVSSHPKVICSYSALKRRYSHGGGSQHILWSRGRLKLADLCLKQREGGYLCATLVS